MGSIVSFPVLCIINLAICRWVVELDSRRPWSLRDVPLLVNGDDAVFLASPTGFRLWKRIATMCGLSPSPGKVYYSQTFLNLNSTHFEYRTLPFSMERSYKEGTRIQDRRSTAPWETFELCRPLDRSFAYRGVYYSRTPYVNVGLLNGFKRAQSKSSSTFESDGSTVGSRARELLALAPHSMHETLLSMFIARNRKALTTFVLPWFLPEELGGLGLPIVGDYRPRAIDLRVARKLYEHPGKFPLPSKPVNAPWKVWSYVSKRFDSVSLLPDHYLEMAPSVRLPGSGTQSNGPMSMDVLRSLACIEAIFRVNGISSLYEQRLTSDEQEVQLYARKLSKAWDRAMRDRTIPMPEPFSLSNLPHCPKQSALLALLRVSNPTLDFTIPRGATLVSSLDVLMDAIGLPSTSLTL